jgi:hypothetical protein
VGEAAVTTGLVTARTDKNGRYRVEGLPTVPYYVYAWAQPEYRGKRYCLRLGHDKASDYDAVVPDQGVVRNFRWKTKGVIEDMGPEWFFGGQVRLMTVWRGEDDFLNQATVELGLTPDGPLVDGSAGAPLSFTKRYPDEQFLEDVPVGIYKVKATLVEKGGKRVPLELGQSSEGLSVEGRLEFKLDAGYSGCGGDRGNGTGASSSTWPAPTAQSNAAPEFEPPAPSTRGAGSSTSPAPQGAVAGHGPVTRLPLASSRLQKLRGGSRHETEDRIDPRCRARRRRSGPE